MTARYKMLSYPCFNVLETFKLTNPVLYYVQKVMYIFLKVLIMLAFPPSHQD